MSRDGFLIATIDVSSGKPRNARFISSLEAITRSTVSQRDRRTSFGGLLRCRPNAVSGASQGAFWMTRLVCDSDAQTMEECNKNLMESLFCCATRLNNTV